MLNFEKLSSKISNITLELSNESYASNARLEKALKLYEKSINNDFRLGEIISDNLDKFPWPVARPFELMSNIKDKPYDLIDKYSVVSTDGSQITPNYHEIATCYLINIGKILYTYGTAEKPIQESEPFIYENDKKFFPFANINITDDIVAIKRMLVEIEQLALLCKKAKEKGYPAIAILDGTLIAWNITSQNLTLEVQDRILNIFLEKINDIRKLEIPLCGYISNSRRNDFVNLLRLNLCPFEEIDCKNKCSDKEMCNDIIPLYDRQIWVRKLKTWQRSPIFISTAKIIDKYQDNQICFFYINAGNSEIARIEIPRWVAENDKYIDLIHYTICEQIEKGQGYPISLQEAHNQAVVKNSDKIQFYSMLSRKMINKNLKVSLSNKELKKRSGIT
ncbi:MAG: nuclease [Candidatus Sericytochromatia bacterium]|nr:MAG: nuclease [Candidatus Sericytochromatia bacterium]